MVSQMCDNENPNLIWKVYIFGFDLVDIAEQNGRIGKRKNIWMKIEQEQN